MKFLLIRFLHVHCILFTDNLSQITPGSLKPFYLQYINASLTSTLYKSEISSYQSFLKINCSLPNISKTQFSYL